MEITLRRILAASLALLVLFAIAKVVCAAFLDPLYSVDVVFDDAYYYLQVAYNIAHGAGSTFDGITVTNGYQPLWMALVTAIEFVFQFDKTWFLTAVVLLAYTIVSGSAVFSLMRFEKSVAIALTLGLLSSYAVYTGVWRWCMETVLMAPVLPWFLLISRKDGEKARDLLTGLLLLYMVTIRLDALSVAVGCATVNGLRLYRRDGPGPACKRAFVYLAPSLVFLGCYAAVNDLFFGTPVPVSGLAKAIGAPRFANWDLAAQYVEESRALLVLGVVLLFLERKSKLYQQDALFYPLMASFCLAILIQLAYYFSFSGWRAWGWYFYNNALLFALVIARIVYISLHETNTAAAREARVSAVLATVIFALVVPTYSYARDISKITTEASFHPTRQTYNKRSIRDVQSWLDGSHPVVVAMGDRSGGLGYWSADDVRVFQTEGLVANIEYLRAREAQRGEQWIVDEIAPDFLMVDRGYVPLMGDEGRQQYVVAEPIQGFATGKSVMVFCFPPSALARRLLDSPEGVRLVFDMHAREDCTTENQEEIREIIDQGRIRRYSLPQEY